MTSRTSLTEYANLAVAELFQMRFVCRQFAGHVRQLEDQLVKHNRRQPDVPPVTNRVFNEAAFRALGVSLLCRAVDLYNWYCRQSLELALQSDPKSVTSAIRNQTGNLVDTIKKADKAGKDAATELIQGFKENKYRNDKNIREAVHCHLKVMQNPEVELICSCRNALVHRRGHDEFGEIAKEVIKLGAKRSLIGATTYPDNHMPIAIGTDGYLVMDETVGDWAAELIHQQVFMMDQNFAHVYKLPRQVWQPRSVSISCPG